ncbi:hypothetical protein CCB80_09220 [Armatimonadetes bacterium Uphvl-Ar1]|nr:hypothetical protein CCB80_09220 [Armatimonadetes bacterium Uphvl-Ar1]
MPKKFFSFKKSNDCLQSWGIAYSSPRRDNRRLRLNAKLPQLILHELLIFAIKVNLEFEPKTVRLGGFFCLWVELLMLA